MSLITHNKWKGFSFIFITLKSKYTEFVMEESITREIAWILHNWYEEEDEEVIPGEEEAIEEWKGKKRK